MMRILHVTESRSWSGGTVQLWNLCKALQRDGHEVGLFCPPNAELLNHTGGSGVRLWTRGMRQDYDVGAAWTLARAIREFKPDIVHAHHPRAHALCLIAGLFAPIPRLVVSRRVSFRFKPWNVFSHLKYRTGRISAYTAVSADIGKGLVDQGVRADKVHVIRSGVDVEKFKPRPPDEAVHAQLGFPAGRSLDREPEPLLLVEGTDGVPGGGEGFDGRTGRAPRPLPFGGQGHRRVGGAGKGPVPRAWRGA